MRTLEVPSFSLVLLIGSSGSGKSSFARARFRPTEIVSSDHYRGVVRDDETDMEGSADAYEIFHLVVDKRLGARRFTVVDATNVRARDRAPLLARAKRFGAPAIGLVLDVDGPTCVARNDARGDRPNSRIYVLRQQEAMRASLPSLASEGFAAVHVLGASEIDALEIRRT
ncbi:MAG: ATP-binding protein [Sandaracinus sp.]